MKHQGDEQIATHVGNLESGNNLKGISDVMDTSFINITGNLYYDLNKIRKLTSEQISILMFMDMVMCTFFGSISTIIF